jgi:NADPH:quinone reductase-like Zn-dependent oxidoreductase
MACGLVRLVQQQQLRPVIDRVFGFDQAAAAVEYLASGSHLSKVVIELAAA